MSENTIKYSADKLAEFKTIISDELKLVEEEATSLQKNLEAQRERLAGANVSFNQTSKHSQEQAKNKQSIDRLQQKSSELQAALKRIENETYGVCERTGELIREERLLAKPTARFDIAQ